MSEDKDNPFQVDLKHILKVKDFGSLKFVRVEDQYRFTITITDHTALVNEGETPVSAGLIGYDLDTPHKVRVLNAQSMTLNIGPLIEDEENIRKIFLAVLEGQ